MHIENVRARQRPSSDKLSPFRAEAAGTSFDARAVGAPGQDSRSDNAAHAKLTELARLLGRRVAGRHHRSFGFSQAALAPALIFAAAVTAAVLFGLSYLARF